MGNSEGCTRRRLTRTQTGFNRSWREYLHEGPFSITSTTKNWNSMQQRIKNRCDYLTSLQDK